MYIPTILFALALSVFILFAHHLGWKVRMFNSDDQSRTTTQSVSKEAGVADDDDDDDVANLYKLEEYPNARCLDGSPGAYYFQRGSGSGLSKWYIFHQGGGWCSSISDCYDRSKTRLGSSVNYPPTMKNFSESGGFFDSNPDTNPLTYNWNKIYFNYCDGLSFTGHNLTTQDYDNNGTTTTMHWKGKYILDAGFDDFKSKLGMTTKNTTDVIISGCSAGGLATFLHCDHYANRLSKEVGSNVKVACVPQSGLFLAYDGLHKYESNMTFMAGIQNASLPEECVRNNSIPMEPNRCIFAEHLFEYIRTPIFPLQSRFDLWNIKWNLASDDPYQINAWGRKVDFRMARLIRAHKHNGYYLDSCFHHCHGFGLEIDFLSPIQATTVWYRSLDRPSERQPLFWGQVEKYPCPDCCNREEPSDIDSYMSES